MEKNRLEAFSDGVFAIIITIMILEIKIPHSAEWKDLQELIPIFLSYVLSFLFVGIYWGNHHHLLHATKKVTTKIMLANLNLLFWLSLTPFVTGWMGENHFAQNPVIAYAIVYFLCGVSYTYLQNSILCTVSSEGRLAIALKKQERKGIFSVICSLVAIPVSYINPIYSCWLFLISTSVWLIPDKNIEAALSEK